MIFDSYISQGNPTTNYGDNTDLYFGDNTGAPAYFRPTIQLRIPGMPSGSKIIGGRLKLYKHTGSTAHPGVAREIRLWGLTSRFAELGVTWNKRDGASNWAVSGGDGIYGSEYQYITFDDTTEWQTFDLDRIINELAPDPGGFLPILFTMSFIGATDYVRYWSVDYTTTPSLQPIFELDVDSQGTTTLSIAPDPADKTRPKLEWTPVNWGEGTTQLIYRKAASSGVTTADTLVANLDMNAHEWIDNTGTLTDNQDYCYAVFVFGDYNSASPIKGNEVTFKRPGITSFYVDAVSDGHQGANIDVQEKVHAHITAAGGTIAKWFIRWGDGGERWFDQAVLPLPEHFYTAAGVMTIYARAENSDGYWSALNVKTGGNSDPNPQAIKPIARMDIVPTTPAPYDEVRLDATRSYARCSDKAIGNKTFGAAGSEGLPAQPQLSPIATCYYPTTGAKTVTLIVVDTTPLQSDQLSKAITVSNPTIQRFESLTDTNIEEVTPSKDRNIDEAPLIGADGAEVIQTGGRAARYTVQGSCIGPNAEVACRTIEEWALTGALVDVPIYDDERVVTQVLRGYLTNFSRQIRGGEPYTKWWNLSVIVVRRLIKVVDEPVTVTVGIGDVAHWPIADYDGDGDRKDDMGVYSQVGGGGTHYTVDDVDYPSYTLANGLRRFLLNGTPTGTVYVTYWYEVNK
jgi:hypothetical protein